MRRLLYAAALCALAAARPARADTLGLTFTGGNPNTDTNDTMAGWRFSTNSPVTVTGLGFWDQGGNGLVASHQVGIWTDGGTLVASGTVAAGTADPLDNGFRVATIAPVALSA